MDTTASDESIEGNISQYSKHRHYPKDDFHLFLMTMWDHYASPLSRDPKFDNVSGADVKVALQKFYPKSWPAFQTLPIGDGTPRRYFMQYSAGYFIKDKEKNKEIYVKNPPLHYADVYKRYVETLMNWIYGNATQFTDESGGVKTVYRHILFDHVLPPEEPRLTILDFVQEFLTNRPRKKA